MKKNKKGLTLIELLAVIAIIAILFVLLIPQVNSGFNKAREAGIMVDFKDLEKNIKSYFMENSEPPNTAKINKYFEKEFTIAYGELKKESPLKTKYNYMTSNETITITTYNEKRTKEYNLIVMRKGSEVISFTTGFSNNINSDKYYSNSNGVFEYYVLDDEVAIKKYIGDSTTVNIPEQIENKPVTIIWASNIKHGQGFLNKEITTVTFPSTLKEIGAASFYNNKIETLNIPNGVNFIGAQAFQINSIRDLNLPSSLEVLTVGVFGANKLTNVNLPNGLKEIQESAFYGNLITTVTIPSSVQVLGKTLFDGNPITTYKLLGTPKFIDNTAFPPNAEKQE